jgi:hypothetical protein
MTAQPSLPYPEADLREHPPRSPREQLAGLVFLPRTIDKVRAKLQGTLGLYHIAPGISGFLFESLGITEEQFTHVVREARNDAQIADWIRSHCDAGTFELINARLREAAIRDEQHRLDVLPRYPVLEENPALRNWFEIIEIDDRWTFDPANPDKVKVTLPS